MKINQIRLFSEQALDVTTCSNYELVNWILKMEHLLGVYLYSFYFLKKQWLLLIRKSRNNGSILKFWVQFFTTGYQDDHFM